MDLVRHSLATAKDIAAVPVRTATSKTAQKAYIGTALFFLLASLLLGISSVSFLVFYNVYIPKIGIERPLYLQFGHGHPHARTDLSQSLTSNQPYDITLSLTLPRTPTNIAVGNFMLDLSLLPHNASAATDRSVLHQILDIPEPIITRSRRPASLTYASPVVGLARTLSGLPLYTLGWKYEHETVEISMFEGVEFRRGSANIPDRIQLILESDEKMQVYAASVSVHARFQGLRWILYHYRLISFFVFTIAFFLTSLGSMGVIYLVFTLGSSSGKKNDSTVKEEEIKSEPQESSEIKVGIQTTSAITGAIGDNVKIKQEDYAPIETAEIAPLGAEADDEDTDDENYDGNTSAWRDSGIGTGREDARDSSRRRKSYAS